MDAPPVQYVKTSDGVSIAYYCLGQGSPLVWLELPSQLLLEEKLFPTQARLYRTVSRTGSLVRYDHRGFGLSDRNITTFPLADLVKDLEAVVDKLSLNQFMLIAAGGFGGPVAVAYTAAHPDRVSKLVLPNMTHVRPALHQQIQALILADSDWRFVSEALSRLVGLGWDDEETARNLAMWFRESCTYETFKAFWQDVAKWDVRSVASTLQTPTIITGMQHGPLLMWEDAREMAASMANAQLTIADGSTYEERTVQYQSVVGAFLYGPSAARPARPTAASPSGTAIILFADIVDSTALTERLGDDAFREKARTLDEAMRSAIRSNGGTAIEGKTLGDGVLAVFTSARQAIACAQACHEAAAANDLALHAGIHAGDVIRESDNVYGGAVNIAARVASASAPGETLVSATVRDLARTSAGVSFEDRGEQSLKGIDDSVRLFAVKQA